MNKKIATLTIFISMLSAQTVFADSGIITASALNVRQQPSSSAKVLGTLLKNAEVNTLSQNGDYYKINYKNDIGYIHNSYVQLTTNQTPNTNTGTQKNGQITASSLNVRSGPGTSYSSLGSLVKNTKVVVYENTNGFYRISYNGKTAYISASYVDIITTSTPSTSTPSTDKPVTSTPPVSTPSTDTNTGTQKNGQITASSLNVRSGPSTSYSSIGSLVKNDKVVVYENTKGFYRISYNGKTAYISASYVDIITTSKPSTDTPSTDKPVTSTPPASTPSTDTANQKDGLITAVSLNIRSGPGTSYSSLGLLAKNTKVVVYENTNGFYRIIYNGKTAYISASYVDTTNTSNTPSTNTPSQVAFTGVGTVLVSSVSVQTTANSDSRVLGSIYPTKKVNIYALENDFYKIKYYGQWGYVHKSYISAVSTPLTSAQYVINGSQYSSSVNMDDLIVYANTFLGMPYLWGGTTPATYDDAGKYLKGGFDCSGFIQYVYKNFDISLPRITTDQIDKGVSVNMNNLQKGDLVFFATDSNSPYEVSHAGIYVGNNKFIHSPKTGDVIKVSDISDYYKTRFIIGKRIIK